LVKTLEENIEPLLTKELG